jgi:hypothetical protein
MKSTHSATDASTPHPRAARFSAISGATALLLAALLTIGLTGPTAMLLGVGIAGGWPTAFRNWLIVLFELNAGIEEVQFGLLRGLNPLDIVILGLVAATLPGIYMHVGKTSRILSMVAAVQPFLGIVLYVATENAGRSAVMGAGLVISAVMLRSNMFGKVAAWVGMLASTLLLIGDFSTTPDSHSSLIAVFIGIGYVLLMMWFLLIARKLFRFSQQQANASFPQQSGQLA